MFSRNKLYVLAALGFAVVLVFIAIFALLLVPKQTVLVPTIVAFAPSETSLPATLPAPTETDQSGSTLQIDVQAQTELPTDVSQNPTEDSGRLIAEVSTVPSASAVGSQAGTTTTTTPAGVPTAAAFPTLPPFPEPTSASLLAADPVLQAPVPNQIVINFSAESTTEERQQYVDSLGGTVVNTIDALDTVVVEVPSGVTQESLPVSPVVEVAEPDYYVSAQVTIPPNDPYYPQQWALPAIGAPEAWANLSSELSSVVVAVIDSGICADHPDLNGRVLPGWDFVEDDATAQDEFGHGCSVAGVIAANINDGIGIAGVAPNALVMPLRVLDTQGRGKYSDVVEAIIFAVDNGAEILNLSLGGAFSSATLEQAVNYASEHNVIIVAAAGNTGTEQILYPSAYSPVIAVGALDRSSLLSTFSSHGSSIDVFAPGEDVISLSNTDYTVHSGTSIAAPHVTGSMALILGANGKIGLVDGLNLLLQSDSAASTEQQNQIPTIEPTEFDEIEPTYVPDSTYLEPLLIVGPSDDRVLYAPPQINTFPHGSIVQITVDNIVQCSGAAIDRRWILTAAHCVYQHESATRIDAGRLRITPRRNGDGPLVDWAPFGSYSVDFYNIPEEYINNNGAPWDIAVLHLSSDLAAEISPVPLAAYQSEALSTFNGLLYSAGYPSDKCYNTLFGYVYECGNGSVDQLFSGKTQWAHYFAHIFQVRSQDFDTDIDAFPGQSGSPVWVRDVNLPVTNRTSIVGVVSRVSNSSDCPNFHVIGEICSDQSRNGISRITTEVLDRLHTWEIPFLENHPATSTSEPSNDTIAPSATWINPLNGSSFPSRTIVLSSNASDNAGGSGVREVRFSAKWNGNWSGIAIVTQPPYIFEWDWCSARVPSGDVELGIEVWDNANNRWVYSEHYPNIHIIKSYTCGSPDAIPPTVSWLSPPNYSTISSETILLSTIASDNTGGSGVREVRFSAKWNNTWSGIGVDTTAPYSISWNWCNAGVPNGNIVVELGLEVWDYANNQWIYSEHLTNIRVTKSYTCGPVATPTPDPSTSVILWEHASYWGQNQAFSSQGSYNLSTSMNDLTSSVQLPSGWSVQLFEHADLQGAERCVNSNVENLASWTFDNIVSSIKVFNAPNCPQTATNNWYVEYFDNIDFTNRQCTETINNITFSRDWPDMRPCQAIGIGETWSARLTGSFTLSGGTYALHAQHDDGIKWQIDGQLRLANWTGAADSWSDDIQLSSGIHSMTIEYRQNYGGAHLSVQVYGPDALPWPPPRPTPSPDQTLLPFPSSLPPVAFGTGADGTWTVAAGQTLYSDEVRTTLTADANAGATNISVGDTTGFTIGSEVLIIGMQGQTAGRYRFGTITAVGTGTLGLAQVLDLDFYTSSNARTQVIRVPNYQNLTVENGGRISAHPWNGSTGGVVAFRVSGTLLVNDSGIISAAGIGFRGATRNNTDANGLQGEGEFSTGNPETRTNGMGGGGGCSFGYGNASGGGGGGYGSQGETGQPGNNNDCMMPGSGGNGQGTDALTVALMGGGGGAGGGKYLNDPHGYGGAGGSGGGIILAFAGNLQLTGLVDASGANGETAYGSNNGANGGGGAGGSVYLAYNVGPDPRPRLRIIGGVGGTYGGSTQDGGDGAIGRMVVFTNQPTPQLPPTDFGDGRDGDVTVLTGQARYTDTIWTVLSSTVNRGETRLPVNTTNGFVVNDEVLVIQMQGLGVGQYEFSHVQSIDSSALVLESGLNYAYTVQGNSHAQVIRVPNFRNLTLQTGAVVTPRGWGDQGNSGGVIAFRVDGTLTIPAGAVISANGTGYRGAGQNTGASGIQGESANGFGSQTWVANGASGGGGCSLGYGNPAGGGGGGHAASGANGNLGNNNGCNIAGAGGGIQGDASLVTLLMGGSGGSGGGKTDGDWRGYGGAGGRGGGIVIIYARAVQISGAITAMGGNGQIGYESNRGANGGGGAGGSILVVYNDGNITVNQLNTSGGSGGRYGNGSSQDGGAGGSGRMLLLQSSEPVIDTTPPLGSITYPSQNDATNSTPLIIEASASDEIAGVNRVEFWANYQTDGVSDWHLLGTDLDLPYSVMWDWSLIPDQEIQLKIDVYDNAGNPNLAAGGTVNFYLDRGTPLAFITNYLPGQYLNTSQVPINVDASDALSGVSAVVFYAGYNTASASGQAIESQSLPIVLPGSSEAVSGQEVTAQEYWNILGSDNDGSDGWNLAWDATNVSDQPGISLFAYIYDRAGNVQGAVVSGLILDRTAPTSAVNTLPAVSTSPAFEISWIGSDNATVSEQLIYDIQYRENSGEWLDLLTNTTLNSIPFLLGRDGYLYEFRSRARDLAGNVEVWPESADSSTTVLVPTNTPTPTPTSTFTPTATETFTPTATVTPSYTPTPTSTYTPIPPSATPTSTATMSSSPTQVVLVPMADAYVHAQNLTTNYGTATTLRTDGSPINRSYLRFDTSGVTGTIISATLRLYATTGSSSSVGYSMQASSGDWTETGITYNNAPVPGSVIASYGRVTANTWTSVDVTSYVSSPGIYNFAMTSTNSTALNYGSRESANSPQLVLIVANGGEAVTATPTSAATATATGVPATATPTATFTMVPPTPTSTSTATVAVITSSPTPTATSTSLPPTPTFTPTASAGTTQVVLVPVADAYVHAQNLTTNYGTATTLRTDGSPILRSYLRFDTSGVTGTIISATLRLYATNGSNNSIGYSMQAANGGWTETGITYNNAPVPGSVIASYGRVTANTWTSVDVTSYVSSPGIYNFAMTSTNSTALNYGSRESANSPQLVLIVANGGEGVTATPTPTATATATATAVPATVTPTATFTLVPPTPTSTPTATATVAVVTPTPTPTATFTLVPPTPTLTPTTSAGTTQIVLVPVADAYVHAQNLTTNYGTATTLRTDGSPILRSYLRFDTSGVTGTIISATLRLYATNGSSYSVGYSMQASSGDWTETGITYNNAPVPGSVIASYGRVTANTWTSVDVTSYVSSPGTYNFAMTSTNSTALNYGSRESANSPQLVLVVSTLQAMSAPVIMPVTVTSTFTATVTETPTATELPPMPTVGTTETLTETPVEPIANPTESATEPPAEPTANPTEMATVTPIETPPPPTVSLTETQPT